MRTSSLVVLLVLSACRSDEVGPVAIQQVVEGAPVRIVEARGRLSMIVGLGSTPTEITSSAHAEADAPVVSWCLRADETEPGACE